MNREQWHVLSIFFTLLAMLFISMSLSWKTSCDMGGEVTMLNIFACVKGETLAPYPYIFFGLGIVFQILAWLEKK